MFLVQAVSQPIYCQALWFLVTTLPVDVDLLTMCNKTHNVAEMHNLEAALEALAERFTQCWTSVVHATLLACLLRVPQ